jgi:hypothetical protein
MDRITEALLKEFSKDNSLDNLTQPVQFEHFSGYLTTSKHFPESFNTDDIHTGSGNDTGIDSIAIIVNGCLITEPDEIQDLVNMNGYLDVVFVFNQAETSSSFDTAKIGQTAFGIKDFFKTTPNLVQNATVSKKFRIANEIFLHSSKFKGNPQCFIYYTTTGTWNNDNNLSARRNQEREEIVNLRLFSKTEFEFIDASHLQSLYRQTKNAISKEFSFPFKVTIPVDLPGVQESHVGLLNALDYIKLIENDDHQIMPSLFYDNVRHWQEWNSVNNEIKTTLASKDQSLYFPLLNNGITIIAKKISSTGNKFKLEDFQIVNGCQSSFVLHNCKEDLSDQIMIPVRIIATDDKDVRDSIIKATNRQTEVTEDQLLALSDFPKKLEAYFPTFEGNKKLYYERRSRQYSGEEGIEKVRTINMTNLVKAFASIFMVVPHRTTRNYKALLEKIGDEIFHKDDRLEMYYISAYLHYKLDFLFRNQTLSPIYKPARYHLLLLFRLLIGGIMLPKFHNSKDMKVYCEKLMNTMWNDQLLKETFLRAVEIVDTAAAGNLDNDNIRTEPFTRKVIETFKATQP